MARADPRRGRRSTGRLERKSRLVTKIGDDHVFPNIEAALAWAQRPRS